MPEFGYRTGLTTRRLGVSLLSCLITISCPSGYLLARWHSRCATAHPRIGQVESFEAPGDREPPRLSAVVDVTQRNCHRFRIHVWLREPFRRPIRWPIESSLESVSPRPPATSFDCPGCREARTERKCPKNQLADVLISVPIAEIHGNVDEHRGDADYPKGLRPLHTNREVLSTSD